MNFVILGLLVVLLIGFIYVVYKAASSWRWYQIVGASLTLLLSIAFLFPTAGVLASRSAWHKTKEDLENRVAQVEAEHREIMYGDPANPELGVGVATLNRQLEQISAEAGRRWRELRLQNVANNNLVLVDPDPADADPAGIPADPAAAAPAAAQLGAAAPLIPEETVVAGFAESLNPDQLMVPTFYMGEFRVVSSAPDQVTITPIGALTPAQLQRINNRQVPSWSLYEIVPLDGHRVFVAEGAQPTEDRYFGRMDEEWIRQNLGNKVKPETLQEYLDDGRRADPTQDPPNTRWSLIEFVKEHSIEVDSEEKRGALDGGYFDNSGRAVDARLQSGEDRRVDFKKGEQILVLEEAGKELIDEGYAELRDRYYLRPLNDYRLVLPRIRLTIASLKKRAEDLEFEKTVLEEAIQKTQDMIVKNQVVKDKLEQDYAQFQEETAAIRTFTEKLQQDVKELRDEMARLHRENIALEKELTQKHMKVKRRLDTFTAAP